MDRLGVNRTPRFQFSGQGFRVFSGGVLVKVVSA